MNSIWKVGAAAVAVAMLGGFYLGRVASDPGPLPAVGQPVTVGATVERGQEVAGVGESADRAYRAGVRVARLEALVSPAGSIAVQGAFLAVLGVGGYRVAGQRASIGLERSAVIFKSAQW